MAKFVVIAGFTDQGIRNVKETVSRAEAFKGWPRRVGGLADIDEVISAVRDRS